MKTIKCSNCKNNPVYAKGLCKRCYMKKYEEDV